MFTHHPQARQLIETEPDVRMFLHQLMKVLDPHYVIETGCYHGTTTEALVLGMYNGHLDTMDIDAYSVQETRRVTEGLNVTVFHCSSLDFKPKELINFAYLDSGIDDFRLLELEHFRPYLASGALVAIHDSKDLWNEWPALLGWRWINLLTQRGLLLLQKEG